MLDWQTLFTYYKQVTAMFKILLMYAKYGELD